MPRAVAYALTDKQLAKLDDLVGDDDAVLDFVNDLEEVWDTKNLVEFDKAWDAMHRCLTDGELLYENGEFPLSYCVLGGRTCLYERRLVHHFQELRTGSSDLQGS